MQLIVYTFRKFCGEHRGWTDEANNAEIEEFSHNQVEEEGDIPCRDAVTNQDRMPGDSWLSEDSCNICTCTGTHVDRYPYPLSKHKDDFQIDLSRENIYVEPPYCQHVEW